MKKNTNTSTDKIQWSDPPKSAIKVGTGEKRARYADFQAALRQNPGRWAKFPANFTTEEQMRTRAATIRSGRLKGFTKGAFELASEDTVLWVRYLGPEFEVDEDDEEPVRVTTRDVNREIRAWADREGIAIPKGSRIPHEVLEAYWNARQKNALHN